MGSPCSGAGKREGPSTERRPPGSIMVISVVQWILLFDADAPIEADEIGAAAEEHVLAVVDDFVDAGMQVGGCAAAEIAAAFDELDAVAGFGEGAGGTHTGDAAADDGDGASFVMSRRLQEFPHEQKYTDKIKSRSYAALTSETNVCGAPSMLRSG